MGAPLNSAQQFGRAFSLVLLNSAGEGQDLSALRFRFDVQAADIETPNTARIRIYNVGADLAKLIIAEYGSVVLSAGYGSNVGEIFKGTVKQFRRGKERNVDSFLDVFAADGDTAYNFSLANQTLAAGSTPAQRFQQLA